MSLASIENITALAYTVVSTMTREEAGCLHRLDYVIAPQREQTTNLEVKESLRALG